MKPAQYHHIARLFFQRHCMLEYYDSKNNFLGREKIKIEHDERFLYTGIELDQHYVTYNEEFEIIVNEPYDIKKIGEKYYYAPLNTGKPFSQNQINLMIIKKINNLPIDKIPKFLKYQLKKYPDNESINFGGETIPSKKDVLKEWKTLLNDKNTFYDSVNNWYDYPNKKQAKARSWINARIRYKNQRALKHSKDITLEELFIDSDALPCLLNLLENQKFIEYDHFLGRYKWLSKGLYLFKLGKDLEEKGYFRTKPTNAILYNALTKFFSLRAGDRSSERTFRGMEYEEIPFHKSKMFDFIPDYND